MLKLFLVTIETGFYRFSAAVEARTLFSSSQGLLLQLARTEREQLQQLKEINDVQFFDRLGQTVAPALATAVERAVQPLASQHEATVGKLEDANRTGAEGLLTKFSESLHGSAGTELKELSLALVQTKDALSAVRNDFAGSGQAFADRMSEASERLERLIADASGQFHANNQASREQLRHFYPLSRTLRRRQRSGSIDTPQKAGALPHEPCATAWRRCSVELINGWRTSNRPCPLCKGA